VIEREPTPQVATVPIGTDDERHLAMMRARLQDIFGELHLVRDVITVSVEAMHAEVSDLHPEVGRVLFCCGAEKLNGQLQSLSDLIEQLGGRTKFTDEPRHDEASEREEVDHVGA
jgi:hypothetical protein